MIAAPTVGAASPTSWSHRDARLCSPASSGRAACQAVARVLYANGVEFHARSSQELSKIAKPAASVSYTAVGIRTAYGITAQGDPSRVIAIVDAYDNPNAYAHLSTYRSSMSLPGMPNCTLAQLTGLTSSSTSPCFAQVNQNGAATPLPTADTGWSTEMDLDLQAASAVCPKCSIALFEANSNSFADLGTAVTTASNTAHVLAISNSYSSSGDVAGSAAPDWDNAAQKGIAVMASSGDNGYGVGFPASATYVLGVGGTNVQVGANGARTSETAWSGAGSGCSTNNAAPSWQVITGNPCGTMKAVADLSADADPNSGLQIYTTYAGITTWWIFGGTSLSSPLVASLYAMQGGFNSTTLAGQYAWASTTPYYDVTSGSNGSCSPSALCNAGPGWDGPTGRGSISVAAASPVLTTIKVSPSSASVLTGGTQQFSATGYDQNGVPLSSQPPFAWSVSSGGGTINASSGLFTAGSTAGGPFTVKATSGSVTGTASVTVTQPAPDFSLSVSPSSQSVSRGSTATYTVTVTSLNGFAGMVSLSLAGAPSGSTVTFSPKSTGTTSTLTIKTASFTSRRTYSLTITGSSTGTPSHTAKASLTVTR